MSETQTKSYKEKDLLIRENEISRKMYIIRSGKVRVFKHYMGQKITLAVLSAGEMVGEFSFFDGKPRSASVEALTNVEAVEIDGDAAQKQIKNLPDWVISILKNVFTRFREADHRLTILQSMNDFEKKHFKSDSYAKAIFNELVRYNKTLEILAQKSDSFSKSEMWDQLSDVLGDKRINLHLYWGVLQDNDLLTKVSETPTRYEINKANFKQWQDYMLSEIKDERYTLISHAAFALLKRVVAICQFQQPKQRVTFADIDIETLPLADEAIKDLKERKILEPANESYEFNPGALAQTFHMQSLMKNFDHGISQL